MTSRAPTEDQAVSGAAIESIANVVRASIRDGSVDVGSLAGLAKAVASAVASHAGGPALDALIRHRARVVGVANGQRVPEDWHRLSAPSLVQRALRGGGSASWKLDAGEVNLVFAAIHGAGYPGPAGTSRVGSLHA